MSNLIAVQDHESAGAITYWRLAGAVNLDTLRRAWLSEGLDEADLPPAPDPEIALRRAVNAQAGRRRLVRPLQRRGAWVVQDEEISEVMGRPTAKHTDVAVIRWTGNLAAAYPFEILSADVGFAAYSAVHDAIIAAYNDALGKLDPHDISAWLIERANKLDATGLRDTGGIYFIPSPGVPTWKRTMSALNVATGNTHKVFRIAALRDQDAVAAILDAITQEALSEVARFREILIEGEVGARGLQARARECQGVLDKVERYEALVGARLDPLRKSIEDMQANLGAAALKAQHEAEQKANAA